MRIIFFASRIFLSDFILHLLFRSSNNCNMKKTLLYISGIVVLIIFFCSCKQHITPANTIIPKKDVKQIAATTINSPGTRNSRSVVSTGPSAYRQLSAVIKRADNKKQDIANGITTIEGKVGESDKEDENDMYDGAQAREEFEYNRIKEHRIPKHNLITPVHELQH